MWQAASRAPVGADGRCWAGQRAAFSAEYFQPFAAGWEYRHQYAYAQPATLAHLPLALWPPRPPESSGSASYSSYTPSCSSSASSYTPSPERQRPAAAPAAAPAVAPAGAAAEGSPRTSAPPGEATDSGGGGHDPRTQETTSSADAAAARLRAEGAPNRPPMQR